jgi:hypothetical protein
MIASQSLKEGELSLSSPFELFYLDVKLPFVSASRALEYPAWIGNSVWICAPRCLPATRANVYGYKVDRFVFQMLILHLPPPIRPRLLDGFAQALVGNASESNLFVFHPAIQCPT